MPRLRPIRLGALEALADQLRFVPRATIRKQLLRAQSLAMELQGEQTYREDWLVQQITGYKPELESPALMPGEALRGELSAFIERLSDSARLTMDDAPAGALRVDALASRWGVSTASVGRYRARGLLAWRVRTTTGHPVLIFPLACAAWFEEREAGLLAKACGFSRLEETDRVRLRDMARRAAARFGWNQSVTVALLAQRTGRSNEAMRQLLQDDRQSIAVFTGKRTYTKAQRERSLARLKPETLPGTIATSWGVSTQTIRRASISKRAKFVLELSLPAGAEVVELPDEALLARLPIFPMASALRAWLADCRGDGLVDVGLETRAARGVFVWQIRADAKRSGLVANHISATVLDEVETDLRRAAQLVARVVLMHRRTILISIESRLGCVMEVLGPVDARRVYDEAHRAACRAVLGHDPARGARVAGVITLAADRAVALLLAGHDIHPPERVGKSPQEARAVANVTLDPWWRRVSPWSGALLLSAEEMLELDDLPERYGVVLRLRFGSGRAMPRSVAQTAEYLGTTVMAVVRMERTARQMLGERETARASDR